MRVRFHGAVRTVTGSMHYLHVNDDRILLDCGLYQGSRRAARQINETFPFRPSDISAVVLSHAHIDHSGNLPTLVKRGFSGSIHATPATVDVCKALLPDSAHLQEKDAQYLNKKRHKEIRNGAQPAEPLYTQADVEKTLSLFRSTPYDQSFEVARGVVARFQDAGHILGSAAVVLDLEESGRTVRLAFTGDVGRPDYPILRSPVPIPNPVDHVISESTYGGRDHAPVKDLEAELARVLRPAIERGARIVVPAFAVGRTQNLVYYLHRLADAGALPAVPIYVDSPLSVNATKSYRAHPECFDQDMLAFMEQGKDPFGFESLRYVASVDESKRLNDTPGPAVIIASSGMCEGGRVLHHLKHSVEDPNNLVLIVGYQAPNTLGKRLVDRDSRIRIYGDFYRLRAEVQTLNGLSAHAGRSELAAYLDNLDRTSTKSIFLVHGDEEQSLSFAAHLREKAFPNVIVPEVGNRFEL